MIGVIDEINDDDPRLCLVEDCRDILSKEIVNDDFESIGLDRRSQPTTVSSSSGVLSVFSTAWGDRGRGSSGSLNSFPDNAGVEGRAFDTFQ